VYIERRLAPLNIHLRDADAGATTRAIRDYGNAIKELAAINIFAGDLLFKNFGLTRYGRVVFYDYDEIEYLTDCRFRTIPKAPAGADDMSGEVWYPVGPHDIVNFQTGEWLAYTVNVPQSGKYDIGARVASKYSSSTAFHIEVDGVDVTGPITADTGSWTGFQWLGKQGVDLAAGTRVVKIVADKEYFGLNALRVLASAATTPIEKYIACVHE